MSPGWTAAIGTSRDFIGADEFRRGLGLQRGEISGHRAGPPAHALVEIAAGQQERDQHQRRVEIGMLGVIDGFDHATSPSASTMPMLIGTSMLVVRARSARNAERKNGWPA